MFWPSVKDCLFVNVDKENIVEIWCYIEMVHEVIRGIIVIVSD